MSTVNPRINITIPKDVADILEKAASRENTSMSKIAAEMIEWAIEEREDIYYSKIADEAEKKHHKWIDNSDEVWK